MAERLDKCKESPRLRRRDERLWRESGLEGLSLLRATYENQRFSTHVQDTYVIGTNLRGLASCDDRPDHVVTPGSLGVVSPGEPHGGHRVSEEEPWVYLAVYPTQQLLRHLLEEITGAPAANPGFSRRVYHDPELVERFVWAHRASFYSGDPLVGEESLLEALGLLLLRYSGLRRAPRSVGNESTRVARAIEFMEDNLESPLSLAEVAEVSNLSRFHFLRVFKRHTGLTPHAFLMQQRVERAKRLLRRGDAIAAVAYGSGFADQAHLSRRFRQLIGVSPGEFQRGAIAS